MSDKANADTGGADNGAESSFTPITSQADLDRLLGDRLARERAKFGDYEDLREKASRLDQIEEASKSELEKAQSAAQRLKDELDGLKKSAQLSQLKSEVAAAKGVPADLLTGATRDEMEAHADQLIAYRGEQGPPKKLAPYVPGEGGGGAAPQSTADVFAGFREERFK